MKSQVCRVCLFIFIMKLVLSFASLQYTAVLILPLHWCLLYNVTRNRGRGRGYGCTQAIIMRDLNMDRLPTSTLDFVRVKICAGALCMEKRDTYCIYLHPRLSEQETVQSLMKSPSTCLKPVLVWWDPLSPTIYHRQHNQAKRSLLQTEHPSWLSIPYLALL